MHLLRMYLGENASKVARFYHYVVGTISVEVLDNSIILFLRYLKASMIEESLARCHR